MVLDSHAWHKRKRRKGKRQENRHWHLDYLKYGLSLSKSKRKGRLKRFAAFLFLVRKRSYLASGAR